MTAPSPIPIQNVYYLLAYAWDHFRPGEQVEVDSSRCPDVHNLLASLISNGIRRLMTRGIDKGYEKFEEETPRLRGRIQLLASYRRLTQVSGRMRCEFDELTADTLPNQILRSTCERLLRQPQQLTAENRTDARHALGLLNDISTIRLDSRTFQRVQLHRNNRHYRLMLHVCQLLHELYLPEERTGKRRFRDILREETIMHRLFEAFVLRFARRHCDADNISPMQIRWVGTWGSDVEQVLPRMITDVTIERPDRKTIVDCKYYRDALVTRHNRHRLHSSHLYQLSAYLQNKSRSPGWEQVSGILLYPAVNHNRDLQFELLGHPFAIRSIDLDQPWPSIHQRLLQILS